MDEPADLSTPNTSVAGSPPAQPSLSEMINSLRAEKENYDKILNEMKKATAEYAELLAKQHLWGTAAAGQAPPKEKTMEDIAQEQADALLKKYFKK